MDVKLNITKVSKFMPDFSDMRDFTPEESEAYSQSLKKVYRPMGVTVDNLIENTDKEEP